MGFGSENVEDHEQSKEQEIKKSEQQPTQETQENLIQTLQKKAIQGDQEAKLKLANCYFKGNGVEKNVKIAIKYWEEVQNLQEACFNLAHCYQQGIGVKKDALYAIELYKNAAKQGEINALYLVAELYYLQDQYDKSFDYIEQFLQQNETEKGLYLKACIFEIYDKSKEAFALFQKAAATLKSPESLLKLGHYYYEGCVVEQNKQQALSMYIKSNNLKEQADALNSIGLLLEEGFKEDGSWEEPNSQHIKAAYEKYCQAEKLGEIKGSVNRCFLILEQQYEDPDLTMEDVKLKLQNCAQEGDEDANFLLQKYYSQ